MNDKKALVDRLVRIEGQVRGIRKMIEEDRYCVDILLQVGAVKAGVTKLGLSIMEGHTRGCVTKAIKGNEGDKYVSELMDVLNKFTK